MDNIATLVNTHSEYFWKTAAKIKQRQIEVDTEKSRIAAFKNPFDILASMIGAASSAVITAFNKGILSKLTEVKHTLLPTITDTDEFTNERPFIPRSTKVKWLTKNDTIVDPVFCQPLSGQEWEADDPDIPQPIIDTHLHCRCKLVPVLFE